MKVLHIITDLDIGGAELMLKRLIESQPCSSGITHTVISLRGFGSLGKVLVDKGFTVYALDIHDVRSIIPNFIQLRRLIRKLRPDIIHTWLYHADLLGGIAAKSCGFSNIIWCVRSTDISKGGSKATLFVRRICSLLSSIVPSTIIFAAEKSREIHLNLGYDASKSVVIPNGFDFDALSGASLCFPSLRTEFGIRPELKVIISVGRFSEVKDFQTFISAATILLASGRNDVAFLLVGRGLDSSNHCLSNMIKESCFEDYFFLAGESKNVPAFMKASDIFCLHSVTEGFPNVLGEAMALGLPSITTDVGDAAYLLDDPEWVVPPSDPSKLAERLGKMLSLSDDKRKNIGLKSASRIRNLFSIDSISRKYMALYKTLM